MLEASRGDSRTVAYTDDELVRRYVALVYRASRRYFAPGMEREDVVQEGMIGLLSAIRTYRRDPRGPFEPFASMCVVRRIQTAVTRAKSDRHSPLNTAIPLDFARMVARDESLPLLSLPANLSELERQVLRLCRRGHGRDEIAALLARDSKSIENALRRARLKLRDA